MTDEDEPFDYDMYEDDMRAERDYGVPVDDDPDEDYPDED